MPVKMASTKLQGVAPWDATKWKVLGSMFLLPSMVSYCPAGMTQVRTAAMTMMMNTITNALGIRKLFCLFMGLYLLKVGPGDQKSSGRSKMVFTRMRALSRRERNTAYSVSAWWLAPRTPTPHSTGTPSMAT